MLIAKKPDNESGRIQALRSYEILDTDADREYDDIVNLAAHVCDVPIALVSLVDETRQWFKAKCGIGADETPRELAFCAHAILSDEVMVVPDALDDPRFAKNPLVTDDPKIRFYAGAPLITRDGFKLGTLCAIDLQPKVFSKEREKLLEALARQVMAQMEFRRVAAQLAKALGHIKELSGVLPICSHCKGIRNDKGYWSRLETFLALNSDIELTHSICPKCMAKNYGPRP